MTYLFKFLGYFILSFIILSLPFQEERVFDWIYDTTIPQTKKIIKNFKNDALENIKKGKSLGKKYLLNIEPEQIEDQVSRSNSAVQGYIQAELEPLEEYTAEEKAILKKILEEPVKE